MKQRMCFGIVLYGSVKCLEYQRIVIVITRDIRNDAAVIEVEYSTEIYLVYFNSFIPFEFGYIGEPLLIGLFRIELRFKRFSARYCGFFACLVQPRWLYLIVDLIPITRQMRKIRLSLT